MPANFYWVKCVSFLPFHDHDRPSELPRFSVNFREPSGPYRKLPKMLWRPLSTFKTGVKDTNFSVFWFCWNTKSSFKAWSINCGKWIKLLSLIMYVRTICLDLWARLEKLSLKYKIDVFSPQSWESHTMRESWQAYTYWIRASWGVHHSSWVRDMKGRNTYSFSNRKFWQK